MNYHLISAIIKGVWAMDEAAALSYAPLLNNIIGQSPVVFEFDKQQFQIKSFNPDSSEELPFDDLTEPEKGSIAIIPISGPLMKNDQLCGPVGMSSIGEIIKAADNNENIDGIILKIDSPGGTVDGTSALAEIIKATSKPIIAFADGLVASAALWLAASTDEIIAAENKTQIGSIGVMLSFADMQPAYEKLGVKFHTINADQSSEKNKIFTDLKAGKYDQYKKEVLNPLAEDFINHIKANLPGVTEEHLTGKVFFAENVVGSLVNSIGNFDYAVSRISELIEENKSNLNTNNNTATMKKFEAIDKVVGAELQTTDEGAHLNTEQLETVNTALEQSGTEAEALETANTATAAAEEAQQTAENSLTEANTTIETLNAEIVELKKKPGAESAKAVTAKDKVVTDDDKSKTVTSDSKSFIENLEAVSEEYL